MVYVTMCMLFLLVSGLFAEPSDLVAIKELTASEKAVSEVLIPKRPVQTYRAQGLRDPFEPYATEKKEQGTSKEASNIAKQQEAVKPFPNLTIQGLAWGGDFPQAIVDNKVLKIGQMIEGASVKKIDKDGVTFLFEGKEYMVPVVISNYKPANKNIIPGGQYEKKF